MQQTNMWTQGLILAMSLVYSCSNALTQPASFWQSYAPGELLRQLDWMTLNEEWQTTTAAALPPVHNNVQLSKRATARSDDADSHAASDEQDDKEEEAHEADVGEPGAETYDEAYESFVRKYFAEKLESSKESAEQDFEPLNAQLPDKSTDAKSKKTKQLNCKEVKEFKHTCRICKDVHTGEQSKTCSYQKHSSEPQNYAYEVGSKYRKEKDAKYRLGADDAEEPQAATATDDGAAAEGVEYNDSLESTAAKPKRTTHVRRYDDDDHVSTHNSSTDCVKQQMGAHKICYTCTDRHGEKFVKCYAEYGMAFANGSVTNATHVPSSHSTNPRINKRTVSYIYEQSSNGTGAAEHGDSLEVGTTKPKQKRMLSVKIVKKKLLH